MCPFFVTEEQTKVEQAMRNIIPLLNYSIKEIAGKRHLFGKTNDPKVLELLYMKIREQRILAAGRKMLKTRTIDNIVHFSVHKQAATVGKISFCQLEGESPLGAITIKIASPQLESLINWLMPYTRDGKIVHLNESPVWRE
jgi:predicted RNA binding protein with dsRBD fold (UPF0201 family)